MTTDDSLLSAWLADDLDDDEAAALETRLATDPALARRLDAMADAVAGLRRLDAVATPAGLQDRVRERVAAELAPGRPSGASRQDLDLAGAVALDGARPRSAERGRWARPLSIAAAVVAVAVVGAGAVSVVTSGGLGGGGETADSRAAVESEAVEESEAASGAAEGSGLTEAGPVIVEGPLPPPATASTAAARAAPEEEGGSESAAAEGDESVEDPEGGAGASVAPVPPESGLLDVGEIQPLLGLELEEAGALAQQYRSVIAAAPAFATGARPDACLDTVTAQATGPLVPVRVQATTVEGAPALAYVLVGARPGSSVLDRVEVWVTDPQTCATRQFLQR